MSTGSNPDHIVEVASDQQLFVDWPDGNTSQFYATYYDQDSPNRETGSSYTLPEHAWEALRSADRLYYRVGTGPVPRAAGMTTRSRPTTGPSPRHSGFSAAQGGVEEPTSLDLPIIIAENDTVSSDGDAPRFQVSTGTNSYYIVEIAADYNLFVDWPDGNTEEFYATYYDQDSPNRETGNSYAMPDHAWEALRHAERACTTESVRQSTETGWEDYAVSTDDGVEPPFMEVTPAEERVPPGRVSKTTGKAHRRQYTGTPPQKAEPHANRPAASAPPPMPARPVWGGSSRSAEEALQAAGKPALHARASGGPRRGQHVP